MQFGTPHIWGVPVFNNTDGIYPGRDVICQVAGSHCHSLLPDGRLGTIGNRASAFTEPAKSEDMNPLRPFVAQARFFTLALILILGLCPSCVPTLQPTEVHTQPAATVSSGATLAIPGDRIAANGYHTCILTAEGGVKCWGANDYGQLGDGTTTQRSTPVDVKGLTSGVATLAVGKFHTCVVMEASRGGGVKCWGNNTYGQLGDGTTTSQSTPVNLSDLANGVTALAAGESHTCALTADGVECWGANWNGQLGDSTTTARSRPVHVSGLTGGVAALVAGERHTCVLMDAAHGGAVKCWGDDYFGELGNGSTADATTPVDVSGLASGVTALATGGWHTCALTDAAHGGRVKCWGLNSRGQLGDSTAAKRTTPADVNGLASGVTALVAGFEHTCALTAGGTVQCWGGNTAGQLGDGTTTSRQSPEEVSGLTRGVVALAAGWYHTCAMMDVSLGGGIKCWGDDQFGQLGDGTNAQRTPVDVNTLTAGVAGLAAGSEHTCAVLDGAHGSGAMCWGHNSFGQLGDGTTVNRTAPVVVAGLVSGVTILAMGGDHTCAVMVGGSVKCWGNNRFGQLGDGTDITRIAPVDVSGLAGGVIALVAGERHTCAVTVVGGVKCWGDNTFGQLGNGFTTPQSVPTDVIGLESGVVALAAGGWHTCALMDADHGGGVKCWGLNSSGQLGDGTDNQRNAPTDVNGLASGVTAVAAGFEHTCALTAEGAVKCWGANNSGQLGDGTTTSRNTPVDVSTLVNGITALAVGFEHTCALTAEGAVKCWGANNSGQLGDGTALLRPSPADVSGLDSGVTALVAGFEHTCALRTGGIKCWGSDEYGQLGRGTMLQSLVPVDVAKSFPPHQ